MIENNVVYARLENCDIVAIVDNDNIKYTVCYRDGERITSRLFEFAADAIDFASRLKVDLTKDF
jgi:hypothetical protein